MQKTVAIVGRPNVGKSTLFNRLVGSREAIVHDMSGVTRDRHYGKTDWTGRTFNLIDTGGYVVNSQDLFEREIRKQVDMALQEAQVILFMADVTTGITDQDEAFARILRKTGKPVLVVANKVDNYERIGETAEFYRFGFDEVFPLSSINGSGTGELLDRVIELFGDDEGESEEEEIAKFAVVGKPNVGKSTFINALLGIERNIVSDIAGTTRDSIHTRYNKFGNEFILVDTAGLRRKSKVDEDVEFYSVMRTIKAVETADICFLMIDAREGITAQDQSIVKLVVRRRKGLIVLVNKWDLVEKDTATGERYLNAVRDELKPFTDVPLVLVSSLNKQRIFKAVEEGMRVYNNRRKKIPTSQLNDYLLEVVKQHHPPSYRGNFVKIKYITQLPVKTPAFAFFCNHPQGISESYKRYLENKIREKFDFSGVPLLIFFRQK